MTTLRILLPFLLVVGLWSCGSTEEDLAHVAVGEQYSLDVPTYLSKTTEFNPEASLQYINVDKAVYIMVIDQSKSELEATGVEVTLKDYFDLATLQFETFEAPDQRTIHGMNAIQTEAVGFMNTHHVFYKMAIVESETHFYQILAFTLLEQKEQYAKELQNMIDSFEELSQS